MLVRGGLVVQRMRNARGYTQAELAMLCGKNIKTINRWELGHNEPSFLDVFNVGRRIQFTIEQIFKMVNDIENQDEAA